nr:MAG TPA: Hint (Hedgehog/Intein) domain N-terminal region [Caudoviricetes sp.]
MSLKWYFNASPKALGTQGTSYSIGFTSAGTHFTILRNGTVFKEKFYLYYNDTEAYKSGWKNSAYRTVTFDTEPTGALLTYLEANATAVQEDPYKFKHYYRNNRLIGTGQYRFRPFTAAEPASVEYTVTINNGGTDSIWVYQSDDESTQGDEVTGNNGVYVISKPYITLTTNGSMIEHISHSANIEELSGDSYKINGDGSISVNAICLTGDTLITLADSSQKRIDEITTADKVLSINPETNELEADEIIYCDSAENKTHTEYDIYTLSDGTEIKTVHRHRFYNMERQAMVYMDEWNIGEHFVKIDGSTPMLIAHENKAETVRHYTIFTKNQNYFANGALSGNRFTKKITIKGDSQNEIDRYSQTDKSR